MVARDSAHPDGATRAPLGGARAALLAWSLIALVNAVMFSVLVPPQGGAARIAKRYAYDAGHAIAQGLVAAALTLAWVTARDRLGARLSPRIRWIGDLVAVAAPALALGPSLLTEDLSNLASRLFSKGDEGSSPAFARNALVVAVALGVPASFAIGRLLARPWARWVAVLALLGGAVANHLILRNDYPGAHFYLAWAAAAVGAAALATIPVAGGPRGRAFTIAVGAGALLAAFSIVVRPGPMVTLELLKSSGSTLPPLLSRAWASFDQARGKAHIPRESAPWFKDRAKLAPIPPSAPPLRSAEDLIVLHLTADAVRAEIIGSREHDRLIPEIAQMRDKGVYFDDTHAPGAQTVYTFSAVFSGKYFSQVYWSRRRSGGYWPYKDDSTRFPELLNAAGIPTATIASANWLINDFGVIRGFSEETVVKADDGRKYPSAEELADRIIERIARHGSGPLYLFAHFMDPHAPYRRATGNNPFDRYLASISHVDAQIKRIRAAVEAKGLAGRTIFIVHSDHGEGFGEHGATQHGTNLNEEVLHVPLAIFGPGINARRVSTPVSLIDLGPTILDLFGLSTPAVFMGQSLVPLLRGDRVDFTRPIIAEGRLKQSIIFPDKIKAIRDQRSGTQEVYDLGKDPGELTNLVEMEAIHPDDRLGVLNAFFSVHTLKMPGYRVPYRP